MRRPIRHYGDLPGSPPSVTSILEAGFPKPELVNWKIETTARLAREHPETPVDQLLAKHGPRGDVRGTAVHKLIELHLSGSPTVPEDNPAGECYARWREWWECWEDHPSGGRAEVRVSSDDPLYAGTADYLTDDGHLFDWKTCARLPDFPYVDHVAQLAAYEHAIGEFCVCSVVYISPAGVRQMLLDMTDTERGWRAFRAAHEMCMALWPDEMGGRIHANS